MKRTALLAVVSLLVAGCTIVRINKDDTTTIEHREGVGVGQELANRACRRAGQQVAVIISTANKNAALAQGTGTQVTTFRCSAA